MVILMLLLVPARHWLAARSLTLSEEKTRIVPLTMGFDFLGFTIRRYKTRHTRTGDRLHGMPRKETVKDSGRGSAPCGRR